MQRRQLFWTGLLFGIVVHGSPPAVSADARRLAPVADATLYEDIDGRLANGAGAHLFTGRNGRGEARRALLRFDVTSAVPPGSRVDAVVLELHLSRGRTILEEEVALHRVLRDWGEGDSVAPGNQGGGGEPPAAGDATWIHTAFPGAFWSQAGGDFAVMPSARARIGRPGAFFSWSSPEMLEDVRVWLEDPGANFGWILVGEEGGAATSKRFDSREHPQPPLRPRLTVAFTPPQGRCGDVNRDGRVDTSDARLIQRCALEELPCSTRCDTSGDGVCDFEDALRVQLFVVRRADLFDLVCSDALE